MEDYLYSSDAVVLVGPQGWPRLSLALNYLMKERGPKTLIIFGSGDDVCTEYDRVSYLPLKKRKGVDVILLGGDVLFSENMLPCATACILNILLAQGRRNVLLSGEKDGLTKVVKSLRDLIIGDHDRYGQINMYAAPLPQEVE